MFCGAISVQYFGRRFPDVVVFEQGLNATAKT
jgi:hypothetical protein